MKNHNSNCKCVVCQNEKDFELDKNIIEAAKRGDLIIFAGSGISTESKGIFPNSFYQEILNEFDQDLSDISFSELMSKYCNNNYNGRLKLIQKIRERISYAKSFPEIKNSVTRFHKELSTIHSIREIITTNWDDFFETECGCVPYVTWDDFALENDKDRIVYKIHGSISNYGTIIATSDDYRKCYRDFHKNIIGNKIKTLLASSNKVVVFVGYSMYDEDFLRLMKFIKREMKSLIPQYFIVTLDENIKNRLKENYFIPIITDGTYFISKLKSELIEQDFMLEDLIYEFSENCLSEVVDTHRETVEKDLENYPELLYSIIYQDGLIHCYERVRALKNSGYYSDINNIQSSICGYINLLEKYRENKNYIDLAYIEGYLNALISLMHYKDNLIPPKYYLFDNDEPIFTIQDFYFKREKFVINNVEEVECAKKIILENKGYIVHHSPFL